MENRYEISSSLQSLLDHVEHILDIQINLMRKQDTPRKGLLLDAYTYEGSRTVIAFSNQQIGMLKDFVIAQNAVRLLLKGVAVKQNAYRVLTFTPESAIHGMEQIYLDVLKDEKTRHMDFWMKKKLMFHLYLLFYGTIVDLPWMLISHIIVSKMCPVMRNAQVYYLMKESMRDMHGLASFKDYVPRRYFVMHNGMFFARDLVLGEVLSEVKLNPMISIPEFKKFRNLDIKEMLTHRWQKNPWYQTKVVGDAMVTIIRKLQISERLSVQSPDSYFDMYKLGEEITVQWMNLMHIEKYYVWGTAREQQDALARQNEFEKLARLQIFGEE